MQRMADIRLCWDAACPEPMDQDVTASPGALSFTVISNIKFLEPPKLCTHIQYHLWSLFISLSAPRSMARLPLPLFDLTHSTILPLSPLQPIFLTHLFPMALFVTILSSIVSWCTLPIYPTPCSWNPPHVQLYCYSSNSIPLVILTWPIADTSGRHMHTDWGPDFRLINGLSMCHPNQATYNHHQRTGDDSLNIFDCRIFVLL